MKIFVINEIRRTHANNTCCNHDDFEYTVCTYKNGSKHIIAQCKTCGAKLSDAIAEPVLFENFGLRKSDLPRFDTLLHKKYLKQSKDFENARARSREKTLTEFNRHKRSKDFENARARLREKSLTEFNRHKLSIEEFRQLLRK